MRDTPSAAWKAWSLLGGAVLLAYANALSGPFQFDDRNVILDHPGVHSLGAWGPGIRPLLQATYALNWHFGPGPGGFHLVNVAIHFINTLFVHCLALRLLRRRAASGTGLPEAGALSAALLFALHPMHTEAVTYLSGRSTSLMALFYLGSLLAYLRGREEAAPLWSRAISPGLFVLACFTKETALTLPLALLLCERIGWDPQKVTREALARALRGLTVHALALAGMLLFLGTHGGYRRLLAIALETRSVSANLRSQVEGVGYLLSTWVWPAALNIDPRLPVPPSWTGALVLKAGLLVAGLAVGFGCLRRRPLLAFGVLWVYLHLLPTNSIVPRLDVVNERQIYLPAVGLSLLVAAGFGALGRQLSVTVPWRRAGTAALALGLALLTILRNRDYRSEVALWNRSVAVGPQNPRAWNNLGCAQFQAGHLDPAREAFQHALQLDPGYVRAQANLELTD